jgi:Tfp pilus assembly protein PilO
MKFHSTKILILIIICNIAAIAGYYFLFQYIKTQSKMALSLTSTLDLSQQKNSHFSSLQSIVKDTEGKRQELAAFLLLNDMEITFVEQLETLAKGSGLSVKTNNISSIFSGTVATVKNLQIQLETTGSWSDIMFFSDQLESLPYNIRIQGVSLNRQSGLVSGKTVVSRGSPWTAIFDISVTESI